MYFSDPYDITVDKLRELVDAKVLEQETLEYKRLIHGDEDLETRDSANSPGGPSYTASRGARVRAAVRRDCDSEWTAILPLAADSGRIEPRISDVRIMPVCLHTGAWCIVIHVPPSHRAPHRVIFKGHGHFYARASNGKHRMDVDELRDQFLRNAGAHWSEKAGYR